MKGVGVGNPVFTVWMGSLARQIKHLFCGKKKARAIQARAFDSAAMSPTAC
jgi:hypothetical protein